MTRTPLRRRTAGWLALAVATSAALLTPSLATAQGGAWSDPFRVSPQAFEDAGTCGGPDAVIADDGTVTYLWCQRVPTGSIGERAVLWSQVHHPDGSVGETQEITTPDTPGDVVDARAATDGSGTVHVAWSRRHEMCNPFCDVRHDVLHVALDGEGAPIGTPTTVVSTAFGSSQVQWLALAVNGGGDALVGWSRYVPADGVSHAEAARIPAVGPKGPTIDLSEGEPAGGVVEVALADSGDAFAAWHRQLGDGVDDGSLAGRTIDATGAMGDVQTLSAQESTAEQLAAFVRPDGAGTAVFAQYPPASGAQNLLARRVGSDGQAVGTEPVVIAPAADDPRGVRAAAADDGAITAVWEQGSSPYEVRSRVIDPTGALGAANLVLPAGEWASPAIGLAGDGSGMVMVSKYDPDTELDELHALSISPAGTAVGEPERVAVEHDRNNMLFPVAIAVNDRGDAAMGWSEMIDALEFEQEAYGAIHDGTPPDVELWSPAKATVGEPVIVAAEGADRSGVSFDWAFGDGGTDTGRVASHAYGQPGTYTIAVTAEDGAGNAVTVTAPIQVVAPGSGGGGTGGAGDGGAGDSPGAHDGTPPDTKILGGPSGRTRNRRPRLRFIASEAGTTFECKVDRGRWTACKSPQRLRKLRFGKHTFQVRARDAAGNVDRFPDSRQFRVVKPKPKPKRR